MRAFCAFVAWCSIPLSASAQGDIYDLRGGGQTEGSRSILQAVDPVRGLCYLSAPDPLESQLLVTDGTSAGTLRLYPSQPLISSIIQLLPSAFHQGASYFVTSDVQSTQVLARSQGTPASFTILLGPRPEIGDIQVTSVGSSSFGLLIGGFASFSLGNELYITDGTPAGTVLVGDLNPGVGSLNPRNFVEMSGGIVLFEGNTEGLGHELWRTNGTAGGSFMLRDIRLGSQPGQIRQITPIGPYAVFSAEFAFNQRALFTTDATIAGTRRLDLGSATPAASNPLGLTRFRDRVYFYATTAANGQELWSTDGITAALVWDAVPGPTSGIASDAAAPVVFGDALYFVANDGVRGEELWMLRGSSPELYADIAIGFESSSPRDMIAASDGIYLLADDRVHGREVWFADGSPEGAALLADVHAGIQEQIALVNPVGPRLAPVGGGVMALLEDGKFGLEPWFLDGSERRAQILRDFRTFPGSPRSSVPHQLFDADGVLLFAATDDRSGTELWKSESSASETNLLADIAPGIAGSNPREFCQVRGRTFFSAETPTSGRELYLTDGATVSLVADLRAGPRSSHPRQLVAFGDRVFFSADDGVSGRELWCSDGTQAGTRPVVDLAPGAASAEVSSLVVAGSLLYFAAREAGTGLELYATDGTPAGTRIVADLNAGPADGIHAAADSVVAFGDRLAFAGIDAAGQELWITDGTSSTRIDVVPGATSASVRSLGYAVGKLYFTAVTAATGRTPYVSDGTSAGTRVLVDVPAGTAGSFVSRWVEANDRVWFFAQNEVGPLNGSALIHDGSAAAPIGFASNSQFRLSLAQNISWNRLGAGNRLVLAADAGFGVSVGATSDGTLASHYLAEPGPIGLTRIVEFISVGDDVFASVTAGIPNVGGELLRLGLSGPLRGSVAERRHGGCSARTSLAQLVTRGYPVLSSPSFAVRLVEAPPTQPALLFVSGTSTHFAIGSCDLRLPLGQWVELAGSTNASGVAEFPLPIALDPAFLGSELWLQSLVASPGGAFLGFADWSDALQIIVGLP
jgi:ELWxxDGT repeat protein